ncbi:MAG TPA: exodeoxyribonuclease VII small subunit [Clostridiaceae bacterium]|nr:exodeoxyribonuclease VII small subunit [Clostridiaceae bacterium]
MTEKLPLEEMQLYKFGSENSEVAEESEQPQSFQDAVNELKKIVEQLENVQGDLDRSIKLFKKGMRLAKWSESYLTEMEEQIIDIVNQSHSD